MTYPGEKEVYEQCSAEEGEQVVACVREHNSNLRQHPRGSHDDGGKASPDEDEAEAEAATTASAVLVSDKRLPAAVAAACALLLTSPAGKVVQFRLLPTAAGEAA